MADVVSTQFHYFRRSDQWLKEKPYFINLPRSALKENEKTTNEETDPVQGVKVLDLRKHQADLSLDVNGFAMFQHDFSHAQDAELFQGRFHSSRYTVAVTEWLIQLLGCELAKFMSGTIRHRDATFPGKPWGSSESLQPIEAVHVGNFSQ